MEAIVFPWHYFGRKRKLKNRKETVAQNYLVKYPHETVESWFVRFVKFFQVQIFQAFVKNKQVRSSLNNTISYTKLTDAKELVQNWSWNLKEFAQANLSHPSNVELFLFV